MGNFYTNITLATKDHKKVVDFLKSEDTSCYATLAQEKFVCVFPADDGVLFDLARRLSKKFDCPSLAVMNHDDDILMMQLYDKGTILDDYNSSPGYFSGEDTPRSGGDAERLCQIFAPQADSEQLDKILKRDDTFEVQRHHSIVNLLGLPRCTAGSGFRYIAAGDAPLAGIDAGTLVRIGSGEAGDEGILVGPHSHSDSPLSKNASSILEALSSPDGLKKVMEQAQKTALAHQDEILGIKVEGRSTGNAVIVQSEGNMKITAIEIKEAALNPEHVGILEDLVLTALNDAAQKTHEQMRMVNMRIMAGGLGF